MKIRLLSDLSTGEHDGDVVDFDDEKAEHLVAIGAAEATEEAVTPIDDNKEVDNSTSPLSDSDQASPPDPQTSPQVVPPETSNQPESPTIPEEPAPSTPKAPVSSEPSPDLHLG